MKSQKDFRPARPLSGNDDARKSTRLDPSRKSGKERYELYKNLGSDDEDDELRGLRTRESALDYLDPEEE